MPRLRFRQPSASRALTALFCVAAALTSCGSSAASATWRREVYVWQRAWMPAVNGSLDRIAPVADAFQVLAAEVAWTAGRAEVFYAKPDYEALKGTGARVGLVVRIGAYGGPFSVDDSAAASLCDVVEKVLRRARTEGLEPAELQVDFDCAEAKLAGYREWLRALRGVAGATRLVFTALPVWMRHAEEFRALAGAADGFVLQVHSLEKPRNIDAPIVLCDPVRAREWAEHAGRVGVPFRVALPTYGYEVAFDAQGKFIGLAAEGPRRAWPEGTQLREVRTEVEALCALAEELAQQRPANCEGVIWFRLPVAGDRLNWDVRTLSAALRGERPAARLRAGVAWSASDAGLAEIFVENTGEVTLPWPMRVAAKWAGGATVVAGDALAGYGLAWSAREGGAVFVRASAIRVVALAPGRRQRVGWIRFSHETSLQIELPPEPAQK